MIEKKVSSKSIYEGKIVHLKVDDVILPNGKITSREVVRHQGAVAVAALNNKNELILIKQFRYPVDKVLWELPAGKLEKGEEPEQCAKRELAEETGYGAKKWTHLSTFYTTPGFSDEIMHVFLAQGLYNKTLNADDDEFIEVYQISLTRSLEMIKFGEIVDAKTIAGILLTNQTIKSGI